MKPARRYFTVAIAVLGIAAASGGVSKAAASTPTLSTQAVPSSALGGEISDTATIEGGATPTGTVTFNLYGPDDGSCAFPPVFTSTVALVSTQATSDDFKPMTPGAYRWTASYSGDVNNDPVSGACNDAGETSTIQQPTGSPPFCDMAPPSTYSDRSEATVHARNVDCITWFGIARGFNDNTYGPNLAVSRGQMASFLARMLAKAGVPMAENPPDAFDDDNGGIHEPDINQIAALGITDGTTGESGSAYHPALNTRRDDMAKLVYNAFTVVTGTPLPDGPDAFTDDTNGGDPHNDGTNDEQAINALARAGIVMGTGNGKYNPTGLVSRGQFASFFVRMMQVFVDDGHLPATP
jgi:hypothetical protein